MLAPKFTEDTPLPLPGSEGYLRGTAQKCRVLRLEGDECFVQLFQRNLVTWKWEEVRGSSGNTRVARADLYATERLARFCGNPPKRRPARKPRRRA